ncbi:MAG TPA: alkaline phosphatase family protein [Mycobacteriales bacterium]|nr:alkaline phosphatase family protein [Mycobacteriales bacterium]HWA68180.1 alkaline phosphatase family protein [Mycobacteriales bacterium]
MANGGVSRREILAAISAVGAAAAFGLPERVAAATPATPLARTVRRAAATKARGSDLGAIEHVVFLMMENRSYDHYFGAYPKGRGFDDHPAHSLGVFAQDYPAGGELSPRRKLLPFHLDAHAGMECTDDLTHAWGAQHLCWNNGAMDSWVRTHTSKQYEGSPDGAMTMGYYTRRDIPFYWSIADEFTLGDGYHASILGPTHPNRLMANSGTIDPAGTQGGPITYSTDNPNAMWTCSWTTVQELLEDAGVSWKIYHPSDEGPVGSQFQQFGVWDSRLYDPTSNPLVLAVGDHILPYFHQYKDPSSTLYSKAFGPTYPDGLIQDIQAGTLPSVSWIIPPIGWDEHPSSSPDRGAFVTNLVLNALMADADTWSKTVLFLMYDENDGWFDHVPPPTPPANTAGEYLTAATLDSSTLGIRGPLGLGVRVPLLVMSPFSRGGHVVSQVFDHTSQLLLLEDLFGIKVDNISAWRRSTVSSLADALFAGTPDLSMPALASVPDPQVISSGACSELNQDAETGGAVASLPTRQRMPTQQGTTAPATRYFPAAATKRARVPARSGKSTATMKSRANALAHGDRSVLETD